MIIKWQPQAVCDLAGIVTYITSQHSDAGPKTVQRIIHFITAQLDTAPLSGKAGRVVGTRELVVPRSPFVVVYRMHQEAIDILSIRHHARLWPANFS
jgi:toxin ParE1/3/4